MLAVYGDFSTAEMKDQLEKLFARLEGGAASGSSVSRGHREARARDLFRGKTGCHANVLLHRRTGRHAARQRLPGASGGCQYSGPGIQQPAGFEIRTKLGYAYDINAAWAANYDHPGTFRIDGSTKSASTTETIQAIETEVEKIRTAEVTEQRAARSQGRGAEQLRVLLRQSGENAESRDAL